MKRPAMNMSFSAARRLGIWTLVAIVIAGAIFAVTSLRRVVDEVHYTIDLQEVKERHFTQMATKFSMVGTEFYRAKQDGHLSESELGPVMLQLNSIRNILTQLQGLPLTLTETEGLAKLRQEEQRFRVLLTALVDAAAGRKAEMTSAQAVKEIEALIDDAVDQAVFYAYRTSEVIEQRNRTILRGAGDTTATLTVGAIIAVIGGVLLSLLMSSVFKRHLSAILRATEELGRGNFAYRINSRYKDPMGQLARAVDEMGGRLQEYEQRQHVMLDELSARATELERARRQFEHLSPADLAQLEQFSQSLMNKFLHQPTIALKAAAEEGRGYGLLESLRRLFGMEPPA